MTRYVVADLSMTAMLARCRTTAAVLCVCGALAGACSSSTTEKSTDPSPTKCRVTATSNVPSIAASGGTALLTVTAQPECTWRAAPDSNWITELKPIQGQGSGQIEARIPANPTPAARQGTVTINDTSIAIAQDAASCQFQVAPRTATLASGGGNVTVQVTAMSGCSWTAISHASWMSVVSGGTGNGSGSVRISVSANNGPGRSDTLTIAGETVTVSQAAASTPPGPPPGSPPGSPPGCTYTVSPASHSASAAGGAFSTSVTTTSSCAWTATSHDSWINITAGASGSGNGNVAWLVAANSGAARTGTLTIAGQTHSVNQAAIVPAPSSCSYAINPTSGNIAATGGPGSPISVTSGNGCSWTATSNDSWLTVTSGAAGSGNGAVSFAAAGNGGSARSGSLMVAGQTFIVNQAAAVCSPSINPTSQSFGAVGGPGAPIAVAAGSGCAWSANSQASWVIITSGAAGNGNGTVSFMVGPNTGSARSGAIVIAGQTFTVSQSAPCSFSINPNNESFSDKQGSGSVAVTAGAGCAWTAVSNASWITVTSGAIGVGSGTVGYSVSRNRDDDDRVGTITIAGHTFTVQQDEDD